MAASGSTRKRGRYLLDTNVVTALFKQDAAVHAELAAAEQVLLPSTVLGELYYGAARSGRPLERYWLTASAKDGPKPAPGHRCPPG
jgi:predicted nucleic acid-binding protein